MIGEEEFIFPGQILMNYVYSAGAVGSKFLTALRDGKKIMGIRCSQCNLIYVPPRSTCWQCFAKLMEWVELPKQGTVETYTVVHYREPIQPLPIPFAYAIIKLDGADTGFLHLLGEVDLKKIKVGMRVEAVFKEEGEGNILDIKYFKAI